MEMGETIGFKAKLFQEAMFFVIIFTYLSYEYNTGPKWQWSTQQDSFMF